MLKFLKKEKPKIYLGELYVSSRKGVKKFDEWGLFETARLEENVRFHLDQIIDLQKLHEVDEIKELDLALDITIPEYQGGAAGVLGLGVAAFPFFWRPKITVQAKVYRAKSNKTLYEISCTEKMPFKQFFARQFSIRAIFGFKPSYDINDLLPLMYQACLKILHQVKRKSKI